MRLFNNILCHDVPSPEFLNNSILRIRNPNPDLDPTFEMKIDGKSRQQRANFCRFSHLVMANATIFGTKKRDF
jgi:hypothetical protein